MISFRWMPRALLAVVLGLVPFAGCQETQGPPYSPEDALRTFQLPPGFRIELVAAEPQVSDPVAMTFDAQGRLFVLEMSDYPMEEEPQGRVKLLEDVDGNGRVDKSTIFAEGLHFPTGITAWKDGVLVAAAPHIFYLPDADRDNRADEKRIVLTGFNPYNPQLRVNGLLYAIDNWIYGAYPKVGPSRRHPEQFGQPGGPLHFPEHPEIPPVDVADLGTDFRFHPDRLKLEPVSGNSQYGNTFDAAGDRFALWNNNHIRHVVIDHRYLTRNPYLSVSSAMHFPSDHENQSVVYPITENPVYIHESQVGMFTSACGNSAYTGGNFPPPYDRAYFVCEPVHNVVHCDLLEPKGATFEARRALETAEFLASIDSWFKPVFTTIGPDGALYVVDYYRKYVEHPDYVPEGMEGSFSLREGEGLGRIYRILHATSQPAARPRLQGASPAALVRELANTNMWWRMTAQRLLVERQEQSVVPALQTLAGAASSPEGKIHALWTLEGLNKLEPGVVLEALEDRSPIVREHAIRLSEAFLARSDAPSEAIRKKLLTMVDDSPRALFQLACTLGMLPGEVSFRALRHIAARYVEDAWFQIAVLSSAAESAPKWFQALVQEHDFLKAGSGGKKEFLRRISAIIGARQRKDEIADLLTGVNRKAKGGAWWKISSLAGLAEGLKRGSEKPIHLAAETERILISLAEARDSEMAAAALDVAANVRLGSSSRLSEALKRAEQTTRSAGGSVESRVNAVRLLALDPDKSSILKLERFLNSQDPVKLQVAAAAALSRTNDERCIQVLFNRWKEYAAPAREAALSGLLRERKNLEAMLDAIEDQRVPPWTLNRTRIRQLTESRDEKINARAKRLFSEMLDQSRTKIISGYRPALTMKGDPERGSEVFKKNCSSCHKVAEMGVEVGPDLVNLAGRRSKGFFLIEILDPNLNVTPGYEEYVIETKDGRMLTGVLAEESTTGVKLRQKEGAEETILRTHITSLRASQVSAMPEGLEDSINIEQMADLLEYLQNLKN